jgi:hypothetical protein
MGQPRPFVADFPRYFPIMVFPPYRHVPGKTPHPRTHPQGHGYGLAEGYHGPPLTEENWPRHPAYLRGADLFNFAFWWEAHEEWEGPWRLAGKGTMCRLYLQGLVQTAAALIKWHQGNSRGTEKLWGQGRKKLERVSQRQAVYMGLEVGEFAQQVDRFFAQHPRLSPAAYEQPERAPLIRLCL